MAAADGGQRVAWTSWSSCHRRSRRSCGCPWSSELVRCYVCVLLISRRILGCSGAERGKQRLCSIPWAGGQK